MGRLGVGSIQFNIRKTNKNLQYETAFPFFLLEGSARQTVSHLLLPPGPVHSPSKGSWQPAAASESPMRDCLGLVPQLTTGGKQPESKHSERTEGRQKEKEVISNAVQGGQFTTQGSHLVLSLIRGWVNWRLKSSHSRQQLLFGWASKSWLTRKLSQEMQHRRVGLVANTPKFQSFCSHRRKP